MMLVRLGKLVLLAAGFGVLPTAESFAQSATNQDLKAYGSRVGEREQDSTNNNMNSIRRIDSRIKSRIQNRLDARLDRFVAPRSDPKAAYTPQVSDGTKNDR